MPVGHVHMFSFTASQTLARMKTTARISSGVNATGRPCYPSRPSPPPRGNREGKQVVDSSPFRRLAQSVEHHLHTVGVSGSSPLAPTNANSLMPLGLYRPSGSFFAF